MIKIVTRNTKKVLGEKVQIADTFFSRLKGLMFLERWEKFDGLLIKKCNSIHTFFMKFDIDLIFLDRNFRIIKIIRRVRPWRMTLTYFKASQVLELPSGKVPADLDSNDFLEVICSN